MHFEIFAALQRDWEIVARSRSARAACVQWARAHDALRECTSPDDILAWTARGTDKHRSDGVLAALAERSPTDTLAARTLLQALVPGLIRLAVRHGAKYRSEVADDVVTIAIERIRTYPIDRRPRAIAANIILDTHQRLCRTRDRNFEPVDHRYFETEAPTEPDPTFEVIDLVDVAVRRRAIDDAEATLVLAPMVGDLDTDTLAANAGIKPRSLNRRRQRALRRLVQFARSELSA